MSGRFVQQKFLISFWVDPPADEKMAQRYKEIADANFTVVMGGFGATTSEQIERQIALCEKYGLKAIVGDAHKPPEEFPKGPACLGYMLQDEPATSAFPRLGALVQRIRKVRPGRLAYIDLFPDYANRDQLGAETYEEYVARFVKEVDPDVLCMNHYPFMAPEPDTRDAYCHNLEVMRKYSLERKIPHWNFFNCMPFGPHSDPTEGQLRWQIYTSLAYGSKGVLYFCYWTPQGGEFPKGGAIITSDGRQTRHYEEAKRINAHLKNLGPTLMQLTSKEVYRIKPEDDGARILQGTPLKNISKGNYLVGIFEHANGRAAVLLNNYDYACASWPTVEFSAEPDKVIELDQKTGKETQLLDASPDMPGLQISLDSGEGRLFLIARN